MTERIVPVGAGVPGNRRHAAVTRGLVDGGGYVRATNSMSVPLLSDVLKHLLSIRREQVVDARRTDVAV